MYESFTLVWLDTVIQLSAILIAKGIARRNNLAFHDEFAISMVYYLLLGMSKVDEYRLGLFPLYIKD